MAEPNDPPVLTDPVNDLTATQVLKQQQALDALKAGSAPARDTTQPLGASIDSAPSQSSIESRLSELEHMVETLARATVVGGRHRIDDLVEWIKERF